MQAALLGDEAAVKPTTQAHHAPPPAAPREAVDTATPSTAKKRSRQAAPGAAGSSGGEVGVGDVGGGVGVGHEAGSAGAASAPPAPVGARGGLTDWAKKTLRIQRATPPQHAAAVHHATEPAAVQAHTHEQAQVTGEVQGHSGWRFAWQAAASVCNTYPKWHLKLCEDGGMSVHECGRQCVHVTPTNFASLASEPNQEADLKAASIASHHQVPTPPPPHAHNKRGYNT